MRHLYSRIDVKSYSDDAREFVGVASTPNPDRVGDEVDPKGAVYSLPIPLLWQHDQYQPIGEIVEAQVSAKGIQIRGRVFRAEQSRTLKERLDEAWESIKLKLVRGLSIGFIPLSDGLEPLKSGGYRITRWDWHELSAVTIPANVDATILAIKTLDRELLAASGRRKGAIYFSEQDRRDCRKSDVVYLTK